MSKRLKVTIDLPIKRLEEYVDVAMFVEDVIPVALEWMRTSGFTQRTIRTELEQGGHAHIVLEVIDK